jgi:acyl-CoA thioesterase I
MRIVWSLCLVLILVVPRALPAENDRTILILGDSLSAAYGMELKESWPSLLQERLVQDGHAYRVFNSSIVGDTTQSGLARLPRLLSEQQPDIVIIELGGNDGLRGLPLEVTRANLQSMVEQSQAAAAEVILAGVYLPPNYGKSYTEKFSAMYVSLAGETGVSLIPFLLEGVALDPALMQEDGIHPTAKAQAQVLETVWHSLEPMLQ